MTTGFLAPAIPDNAPFTPAQRAWLSGYFAAIFTPSGNGMVREVSRLETSPLPKTQEVEDTPWHDSSISLETRLEMASGRRLPLRLMAAMAQLDCGQCGYDCKKYGEALADGKEKNPGLCAPGGAETRKKLKELLQGASAPVTGLKGGPKEEQPPPSMGYCREKPCVGTFQGNVPLNKSGSAKNTRQVVIHLGQEGPRYEPGDSLGVFPENCDREIDELLKILSLDGAERVRAFQEDEVALRQALRAELDIGHISPKLGEVFGDLAPTPSEKEALFAYLEGDEGSDADLVEIVTRFPWARPTAQQLVDSLQELRPRLYSISSSLKAHPGEVHLTVGVVRREVRGRIRNGVASTFLGERIPEGSPLRVFVQKSHGFRLPSSPEIPVIMIGPGTGIAPFRAFLQERRALGAQGKTWLFFGDQKRASDFLYEEEWETLKREGVLTRLDTAFSRDQGGPKVYVQDRMREHAEELARWLAEGAVVYVCGDALRMARDVDTALAEIITKHLAGGDEKKGRTLLQNLAKEKRYLRDVY